jgi:glucose-1-phosphate adenylyltransferase
MEYTLMKNEIAMILSGGRGKRMDLLCQNRPKPLLPVAGSFRVMDFTLSNCIHSQIEDIAVLVDYLRDQIAGYTIEWQAKNGGSANFRILPPQIGSYTGTANAVYQNLSVLKKSSAEKVLILAGDHIYKMDYRKMTAFHDMMKADVTVGVIRVPVEETHRFGTVTVNAENRISEFKEKSARACSNLASMGIYIFNRDLLAQRLEEDARNPDSLHDFGYSILPQMVENDRVFACEFNGYWQDIGTVEAFYEANMEIIGGHPRFSLDNNWPVLNYNYNLPMTVKTQEGKVVNSLVSQGCVIKGLVENSILSPGVYIDEQAIVRNSLLMANVSVGYHSIIDKCILDEGANIGEFCYIGSDGIPLPGKPEITVLGKDVKVPGTAAIGHKYRAASGLELDTFKPYYLPSGTALVSSNQVNNLNVTMG